jgi:Rieske Fe-S protein
MSHEIPRRAAVGFAVVGAACAACTRYGAPAAPQPQAQTDTNAPPRVLGKAIDIPVNGGVVYKDEKIVVTQPVKGQFTGYSAVCTHQGCLVNDVAAGTINCDCHGSKFALDGSVTTGPATQPLPPVEVTVNESGDVVTGAAAPGTTEPGTTEPPAPPEEPPATGAPAAGLASTGDIPVGGGAVFQAEQVVITQPSPGEFRAYSAVCTHQGCIVNDVKSGTINCNCHGSKFGLDGSVSQGPASAPLPAVAVKVTGDQISLA